MYTKYMRGVDVHDQIRSTYPCDTATKKWSHCLFFFLMDTAFTNACLLHFEGLKALGKKEVSHKEFQMEVAMDLMGIPKGAHDISTSTSHTQLALKVAARVATPWSRNPQGVPQKGGPSCQYSYRSKMRRVCSICGKRTIWFCPGCCKMQVCWGRCFIYTFAWGLD